MQLFLTLVWPSPSHLLLNNVKKKLHFFETTASLRALPRRMFSILDRFLQTFVPSHIFLEKSFAPNFDAVYKCRYLRLYQQVRCTFFLWTIHILCTLSNRTIYKSKQTYNGMHSCCRFIWNRANLLALLRVEAIPTNSLCAVGKTHPTKHLNAFRCSFPVEMFEN